MSLTTILAATLTVVSMIAAVWNHDRFPLRRLSAVGLGTIMLGVVILPNFSRVAAASLAAALTLVVLLGILGIRMRARRPLGYGQRTAVAVPVIDAGFMSAAVLLMPDHTNVLTLASGPPPASVTGHDSLAGMSGGAMTWFVLLVWALCAAVLIIPAMRRSSREGYLDIVCTGCMIGAMAAMAA